VGCLSFLCLFAYCVLGKREQFFVFVLFELFLLSLVCYDGSCQIHILDKEERRCWRGSFFFVPVFDTSVDHLVWFVSAKGEMGEVL